MIVYRVARADPAETTATDALHLLIIPFVVEVLIEVLIIQTVILLPQCEDIYPMLEKLYKVRFHIPKYSEFCTAIGAALNYKQ